MFQSLAVKNNLRAQNAECVVFGFFAEKGKASALDAQTKASVGALGYADSVSAALARPEVTGECGSVVETFATGGKRGQVGKRILLVGLGEKEKFEAGSMRNVAAGIGRRLAAVKARTVALELGGVIKATKVDRDEAGVAFGEGVGLLGWVCDEFRGKATNDSGRVKLEIGPGDAAFGAAMERGLGLAESTNLCRTLSQTPPNVATPFWMAEQAQKMARKHGMSCRVWKGSQLEDDKLIGLINVGKASENKPCMIRLEWAPKGATGKPIVLIGKTMTYDTGGLSLKINNSMVGMKRDKDGGCAVLGAMHAIATVVQPKRRVVAFLVSAENSISEEAYRPDDVLRYRNNVTVEVTNTDAEGRLVLADALCWACEKEDPAYIVDLATLTGGVVVALGSTFCGMFCEDDKLRAKIQAAADASGERVWRLPMHQEYREMMKSPVADIVNSNPNRKAHPIQGAAFLSYFVEEKVPWCHLDIAGVHVAEKNAGPYIEGPAGWGVRLLANLVEG